jgi:hypothetical protein
MTLVRLPALFPILLGAGLLAGCGQDTARNLGLARDVPDEFRVTTRAPLSLPPSLGDLPPPRPGLSRPQEMTPRQSSEALLLGAPRTGPVEPTRGEAALLAQAGTPAPGDIRGTVDEEALRLARLDRDLLDRLIFWQSPPEPGIPVDPTREAQRLRENAALGRAPESGEMPIIQPRQRNLLQRLGLQ